MRRTNNTTAIRRTNRQRQQENKNGGKRTAGRKEKQTNPLDMLGRVSPAAASSKPQTRSLVSPSHFFQLGQTWLHLQAAWKDGRIRTQRNKHKHGDSRTDMGAEQESKKKNTQMSGEWSIPPMSEPPRRASHKLPRERSEPPAVRTTNH